MQAVLDSEASARRGTGVATRCEPGDAGLVFRDQHRIGCGQAPLQSTAYNAQLKLWRHSTSTWSFFLMAAFFEIAGCFASGATSLMPAHQIIPGKTCRPTPPTAHRSRIPSQRAQTRVGLAGHGVHAKTSRLPPWSTAVPCLVATSLVAETSWPSILCYLFLPQRAATAFLAVASRFAGDKAAARACPLFDAPNFEKATAAGLRVFGMSATSGACPVAS